MKSMLWKELRENAKWAALGLLALVLAEFYALSTTRDVDSGLMTDLTVCSSTFLMVTAFGCSAIGAGLALVQILPELRRDQWAALLHRPVPRSTIFFGKALAGLILYACATVPPLLASAAYVATPGQFAAPLIPGMMIPSVSDLLLGPMFYFAAVFACLHRGHWWGSRGAIGLSVVILFIQHLIGAWAFVLPMTATLIYLVAAWAAMESNGSMQSRPFLGRVALVLIVTLGAECLLLAIDAALFFIPTKTVTSVTPYSEFQIAADGRIFTASQSGDGTQVLKDMDGKVVTDPHYISNESREGYCEILPLTWDLRKPIEPRRLYLEQTPRTLGNYLFKINESMDKQVWFLLLKQNYFVGYDKISRREIGICDATGFKSPGQKPVPFAEPIQDSVIFFRSPHLFWSGSKLFGFDFAERTLTTYDLTPQTIYGASDVTGNYLETVPTFVAVATQNELRLFNAKGALVLALPYPHDPDIWSYLSIGANDTGSQIYLESAPSPGEWWNGLNQPFSKEPVFLDVFDATGKLQHTYSRIDSNNVTIAPTWTSRVQVFLSPALPALVGTLFSSFLPFTPTPNEMMGDFVMPQPVLQATVPDLITMFLLNLVLASAVIFCARRVGFSGRRILAWALFVFCFGLPGFAAFRFASDWPSRTRCPECGRYRPLEAATCPHCHQAWPQPHLIGTEIFDPEEAGVA
jgi:hypothetical protein